ncbi:MAG TPA: ImmA/IrrE family metallo-endopeptidase, partial [Chloroflexia bacterium]
MIAVDYALENAAREFWKLAGTAPEYPCDLEGSLTWAVPLDVLAVPRLRVSHVNHHARHAGLPYHFSGRDRHLCGCLLAYKDRGVVFLDAEMAENERRFTLAHELAHFLLDYRAPRIRALAVLGESVRPVLDGLRPPSVEEGVHAVMAGTPLGVVGHLMERPSTGLPSSAVLSIETRADRLALELLAPAALVLEKAARLRRMPYRARIDTLASLLVREHGLPAGIADRYANGLL